MLSVIEDISFTLAENSCTSLLGPSGCGKSTLLNILAGFESVDSGVVNTPRSSFAFQEPTLFDWLTVEENIEFGMKRNSVDKSDRKNITKDYIKKVKLEGFEKAYPPTLSGGMKQRLALARILVMKPKLLLLDEPFGALDAITRREMHRLLFSLWKDSPFASVFVTHDVEEAMIMSEKVMIMSNRPANIKKIIQLPYTYGEGIDHVDSHKFADIKKEIRGYL